MERKPEVRRPKHFRQPWVRSDRPVPRLVVRPLERFLEQEAGSASLLMAAALAALVWANAAPGSYESFWTTPISIDVGLVDLEDDLRHVVNDLLMAVFFYVVALEVKRELLFGSLRERKTAALPVAAALGTMVGAACTYLAVNLVADGDLRGWAIPIATDIAFALGALGLVGDRAPRELRAFLLTVAVVDDLATIAVIGVFFTAGISLAWLAVAAGLAVAVAAARRIGVRSLVAYVLLAGVLWLAVYESGVHATIAGVALGFLTPARALHSRQRTGEVLASQLGEITDADVEVSEATLMETSRLAEEAITPLTKMEERLHPWTAYVVLPLFALANAGVPVSLDDLADALSGPIGLGIVLGLVLGKPLGGVVLTWTTVRLGAGRLQEELDASAIAGMAPLTGVGFTVAIFISGLAFEEQQALQDQAKLAILTGSAAAALLGLVLLYARSATRRAG